MALRQTPSVWHDAPLHYRPEPPSTRPLVLSRFPLFHCSVDLQKDKAGGVGGPGNRSQTSQIQIWCNKRQIAVAGRGRPPATSYHSLNPPTMNLDQAVLLQSAALLLAPQGAPQERQPGAEGCV